MDRLGEVVTIVVDDLTSRSALAGAASFLAIIVALLLWWLWTRRILRFRHTCDHVILVTGSRGKSSTVRLLHAVLTESGLPSYAKTTGSAAAELDCQGHEHRTARFGQVSVLETLATMNRARRLKPRAMVFECMAVKPNLIELIADRMTQPDIVVITNCQVDHLEDQGSTRSEIAGSLAEAITPGSTVFSGEPDGEARRVLIERAQLANAAITFVSGDDVSETVARSLPDVHPQNIAMVFAIATLLGIDQSLAIKAMSRASREPHEFELWERDVGGVPMTYLDFGSLNDPESLLSAARRADWPRDEPRIGILVGRWDRPLRSLEFAGSLNGAVADAYILSGGPVHAVRSALIAEGWRPELLHTVVHGIWWPGRWQRVTRGLARAARPTSESALVLSLENQHESLADRVRRYFLRGRQAGILRLQSEQHVD